MYAHYALAAGKYDITVDWLLQLLLGFCPFLYELEVPGFWFLVSGFRAFEVGYILNILLECVQCRVLLTKDRST